MLDDPAFAAVFALSWTFANGADGRLTRLPANVTDEASIVRAAQQITGTLRLVIVATGVLHGAGLRPERTFRNIESAALLESYRVNAIGPALVAKHLLPLMKADGRNVFAALSARVGSIGDNRMGGWHGYRPSKAALNMIIRNLAIEIARRTPETLCVGLHPGTVNTALSKPFQANVRRGRLFTADHFKLALPWFAALRHRLKKSHPDSG